MGQKETGKGDKIAVIAAIAGVVIMECVALCNGINGEIFTIAIAAVSGLGGYAFHPVLNKKK